MRAVSGTVRKHKVKKILKMAKGYYGSHSKQMKQAKEAVIRGLKYAYRDRRQKKRMMRRLWTLRINAACRVRKVMLNQFSRTQLLLGQDGMDRLANARVAVFGVGGVGGFTVEALARSGVGTIDLIDDDKVCLTNINRQIIALRSTVGKYKVDVAAERLRDINQNIQVNTYKTFYMPDTAHQFDFSQYDYVVDAIDTITGKLELVMQAHKAGTPIICSMGAGNKLDPTAFRVADIYKTSVDPLARVMRYELRRRGIAYDFDASTFWLWGVLGSLIVVGTFINTHKLLKAMNLLAASYNIRG